MPCLQLSCAVPPAVFFIALTPVRCVPQHSLGHRVACRAWLQLLRYDLHGLAGVVWNSQWARYVVISSHELADCSYALTDSSHELTTCSYALTASSRELTAGSYALTVSAHALTTSSCWPGLWTARLHQRLDLDKPHRQARHSCDFIHLPCGTW